jgi:hypothetical protein
MIPLEEIRRRQSYLRARPRMKTVELKMHDPFESLLEGVLARGDRRVGEALRRAYVLGCRYDGWAEHVRPDLWKQAFADVGLDLEALACRTIPYEEPLPWDHLDAGPSKAFLLEDSRKARAEVTAPGCFGKTCNHCGVDVVDCFDLKHAMPALPMSV